MSVKQLKLEVKELNLEIDELMNKYQKLKKKYLKVVGPVKGEFSSEEEEEIVQVENPDSELDEGSESKDSSGSESETDEENI